MKEQWTVASLWNKALDAVPPRKHEPRERLWASELYGSDIDIVLKLRGEQPTNPPDARALRKMDAGRMIEDFVEEVLRRAGILKSSQDRIAFKDPDLLEISGKLDFLAGGVPDKAMIQKLIDEIPDDSSFKKRILTILRDNLSGSELDTKILEIKSAALFTFNKVEATGRPLNGHGLQAYHYARNGKMEAAIVYICRDDMRMIEIPIFPYMEDLEEQYMTKIKTITQYHKSGELPPLEPLSHYDEEFGKFSTNFKVQYSPFLTKLYGFQHPEEYGGPKGMWSKKVKSWNCVLKRIATDKPMTQSNQDYLKEIESFGYDLNFIKENVKELYAKGQVSEEEAEE